MATKTTDKEAVVLETLRAEPGLTEIELAERVKPKGVKRLDTVLKSLRNKRLIVSPPGFGLMAVDNGEPPVIDTMVGLPMPMAEQRVRDLAAELAERAKKRQAKKTKRKPKEGTECLCQCGEMTKGGAFRPGHDVRFHSKIKSGEIELTERMVALVVPFLRDRAVVGTTSESQKPRPCDAKCSFAITHKCNCACGGVNHSQGWFAGLVVREGDELRPDGQSNSRPSEWDWNEDGEAGQ